MPTKTLGKQLAENIAKRRKSLGMTQAKLADIISVEKETMSRIESGLVTPSLSRLEMLADALECPAAELLRDQSDNAKTHAANIVDMIRHLSPDEQSAIVRFVGDAAKLFSNRGRSVPNNQTDDDYPFSE